MFGDTSTTHASSNRAIWGAPVNVTILIHPAPRQKRYVSVREFDVGAGVSQVPFANDVRVQQKTDGIKRVDEFIIHSILSSNGTAKGKTRP